MEWVETTAKTLEEAKELALDRLGVAADEAEFEVLEEPRAGLFGRLRGEARVRARIMPTAARPKQDRRGRGRKLRDGQGKADQAKADQDRQHPTDRAADDTDDISASEPSVEEPAFHDQSDDPPAPRAAESSGNRRSRPPQTEQSKQQSKQHKEQQMNTEDTDVVDVPPAEVGAAADIFMTGLVTAFGATAETTVEIDGSDIEVRVSGAGLGLLVGHGGRTLMAVQDLARVASQRRLGDHETRLRIDVGDYRAKRAEALSRFAVAVANEVLESGTSRALEPMQSADRKVVHDALAEVDGVSSRSEGDDPVRRVVISPA